jgi:hypothetical protein
MVHLPEILCISGKGHSSIQQQIGTPILRTVLGTILQALQAKDHEKVELNASQGWT